MKKLPMGVPITNLIAGREGNDPYSLRHMAAEIARREGVSIPAYESGDDAIKRDRELMVKISRDMFMNNAVYRSIISGLVTATIGEDGVEFKPNVAEPYKSYLQNKFNQWTRFADYSKRKSFTSIERHIATEMFVVGEILLVKRRSDMSLQLIETERIVNVNTDKSDGSLVSVDIKDSSKRSGLTTVKAEDCIYISLTDRPTQTRGCGILWSCLDVVQMLMFVLRSSAKAWGVASQYAVVVEKENANQVAAQLAAQQYTTEEGEAPTEDEDLEGRYVTVDDVQTFFGKVGEKVTVVNQSGVPNTQLGEHVLTFLRIISSVIGCDAATFVLSDYSKVNYSSSKAANVALTRTIKRFQNELAYSLYDRVGRWLVGTWALTDEVFIKADETLIVNSVSWIFPKPAIIDSKSENEAAAKELELGLNSHGDILLARNLDPETVLQKRKAEIIRAYQITEEIKTETNGAVVVPWEILVGAPVSVNKAPQDTNNKQGDIDEEV